MNGDMMGNMGGSRIITTRTDLDLISVPHVQEEHADRILTIIVIGASGKLARRLVKNLAILIALHSLPPSNLGHADTRPSHIAKRFQPFTTSTAEVNFPKTWCLQVGAVHFGLCARVEY